MALRKLEYNTKDASIYSASAGYYMHVEESDLKGIVCQSYNFWDYNLNTHKGNIFDISPWAPKLTYSKNVC